MDIEVRRNAYGRQVDSFETISRCAASITACAACSSAPPGSSAWADVEILATFEDRPVVLEQGNLLVASFHPELVGETGLHDYLLRKV
jgi:5'-phosphate synthase pdxT subunit